MWCVSSNKISLEPPTISSQLKEKDDEIKRLKLKIQNLRYKLSKQLGRFVPINSNDGMRSPTSKDLETRLLKIHGEEDIQDPCNSDVVNGLVFDCGTNETKSILYTLKNNQIQMKEVNNNGWREGVSMHLMKDTPLSFLLEKFEEAYIEACESVPELRLDFCIVGASSWARKFSESASITKRKNQFMQELRDNGFFPCIFHQNEESHFELLATIFGFSVAQLERMISPKIVFGGVLASGGGSSQYTMFEGGCMYSSLNIEIGNREGMNLFREHASLPNNGHPLKALDEWISRMTKRIDEEISKTRGFKKNSGFVLCISAQYYAAVELCKKLPGKFANKSDSANTITAGEVLEFAKRYTQKQRRVWKEMSSQERSNLIESPKKLKSWAMGICNVSLCALYWDRYFTKDATLCFKRDWTFSGNIPYRSTWSAGWFIDMLFCHKNVDMSKSCPQMKIVMKRLKRTRDLKQKLAIDFRSIHPDVSMLVNEMVSSHISNVPHLASCHLNLTKKYISQTAQWMKTISEKLKATQMESSTKTKVALERKLNGVIANLLRRLGKGVIDKSYAPLEVEFTGKITDSLQYNLVFQEKSYYSDVKVLLKFLFEKGCAVKGKNYWSSSSSSSSSSYKGLNLIVQMPPDSLASDLYVDSRFPFEINCHTNDSFELQRGKSRDLCEIIKTERVLARRKQLNRRLCDLWDCVAVPKDEKFEPACFGEFVVDDKNCTIVMCSENIV